MVIVSSLITLTLVACSDPKTKTITPIPAITVPAGEVYLAPDSKKRAYVKTASLQLTSHPLLEPLAGKIVYNEIVTSRISSPMSGRVVTTPVALGTAVSVGTNLLELSSPDVADAEADFIKSQADLTLANHAFNRQQELYLGKAVAHKELEQAQDDLSRAKSDVQRAQQRLKNLHINAGESDGRFILRSPMAGVVVERSVTPGMEIRPDLDTPLFVVSNINKLTVLMNVFEMDLAKIRVGQKLSVSVPAYPDDHFSATVQYIAQVVDENTRTVQVRCDLPNPDGRLLPSMYATISIESDSKDQAIVIPLTAVFTQDDIDYVFIHLDEDHYIQRPVKIGLRLKDTAVITNGLAANEQLVTEGALMLRAEEDAETTSNP